METRCWNLKAVSIAMSGMLLVVASSPMAGNCPNDEKVKKIAITPDYEGKRIAVDPLSETIYLGSDETACWEVSGLEQGDWVELRTTSKATKDIEDPFGAESAKLTDSDPHFEGNRPTTGAAGHAWVYDVFVMHTDSGGTTTVKIGRDPEVVIKGGDRP